ncbi:MAG: HAD-IB family hydrolase [Brevundimonas sp.]|uniref:HAD-IB family hydrolase n=1 Tax=Brevundimonas sp. TaxID=1871086 RepID=UPI0025C1AFB5|nr:HAD-IB family hydrolase [Brevundimonas sp.]MBX3475990.1 HAD-IB family hydrolase [Brevundimonas sp.]
MSDMGAASSIRQSLPSDRLIVAFDFDGTLTVRDSFNAFLKWRAGAGGWYLGLARLAPALAAYVRDRDRGRIKAAAVREFLGGAPRAMLEAEAETFADMMFDRFMRPDALKTWTEWGGRGAHRVIVTASPETTVAPFARRLGAEALLGTRLIFDDQDRVTGAFAGENCRGEEKVRRLRAAYGDGVRLKAAYGDTSGDTEMLAIADAAGFRVFTARP